MSDTNLNALPIGHTIDGYRILRVLGAGGFGITYLAEEVAIGRKVAIKEYLPQGYAARASGSISVLPVSVSAKEQFDWGLDRFRKEAATLVNFEHPNIVAVYRYFEANGTAYLVMQYVEGKPLDALIAGGKTLAESEIEEMILPILDGLEQVHEALFLHRDIKPANIYIRKDGRPVLLDFGAARQAFGSETKSITAIVSEGYAPFEQYEAKGDQGPWTDIYALGAVLYRCITGERPPAAPERVSARLRGAPDPMRPARELGAGRYSARMLAATDRALSTMPGERPQNIRELRKLLTGGEGAPARRPDVASRAGADASAVVSASVQTMVTGAPRPGRRQVLAAAIVAAVAVLGASAYFALTPSTHGPDTAATPPPSNTTVSSASPTDEPAERAAREAEVKAESDLAQIKSAIERGELVHARNAMAGLLLRIEDARRAHPKHPGLARARAAIHAAEAELNSRIAARVKELVEAAEREAARNFDEARRLADEAEELDPEAGKALRARIEAIRKGAESRAEEEEKRRLEAERKRQQEQRRARQTQVELHLSLARYHLDQARAAALEKRYAEARRIAEQSGMQLAKSAELERANGSDGDGAPTAAALRRELAAFERDLEKKVAEHVEGLIIEARRLAGEQKFDEADRMLDEAAQLAPNSPAVADARRESDAARKKADEQRRRPGKTPG